MPIWLRYFCQLIRSQKLRFFTTPWYHVSVSFYLRLSRETSENKEEHVLRYMRLSDRYLRAKKEKRNFNIQGYSKWVSGF